MWWCSVLLFVCWFGAEGSLGGYRHIQEQSDTPVTDKVAFTMHFSLFKNVLSTTPSVPRAHLMVSEVAIPGEEVAGSTQASGEGGSSTGHGGSNGTWQHYFGLGKVFDDWFGSPAQNTTITPRDSAGTEQSTKANNLHVDSQGKNETVADIGMSNAEEASKPNGGSNKLEGSDDETIISRTTPDVRQHMNFFQKFWDTTSGPPDNATSRHGSNDNEFKTANYLSEDNSPREVNKTGIGGGHNSYSTELSLLMNSGDEKNNTKILPRQNATTSIDNASIFQVADNVTARNVTDSEFETASDDDAETSTLITRNWDADDTSSTATHKNDTHFNTAENSSILSDIRNSPDDFSTSGMEFVESTSASYLDNFTGGSSDTNKGLLTDNQLNNTVVAQDNSKKLANSVNKYDLSSGTDNSTANVLSNDVEGESSHSDPTFSIITHSRLRYIENIIIEAFRSVKRRLLEMSDQLSRPIRRFGHGFSRHFDSLAHLTPHGNNSESSHLDLLSNGSVLTTTMQVPPVTGNSYLEVTLPFDGENNVKAADVSVQGLENKSSNVPEKTTHAELSNPPKPPPQTPDWLHISDLIHNYSKSLRVKRELRWKVSDRNSSTEISPGNTVSSPFPNTKALRYDVSTRTAIHTSNHPSSYENALDYPEYFNTKEEKPKPKGISLSPRELWQGIVSWTVSTAEGVRDNLSSYFAPKEYEDEDGMKDHVQYDHHSSISAIDKNSYFNNRMSASENYDLEEYYDDGDIYGETKKSNIPAQIKTS